MAVKFVDSSVNPSIAIELVNGELFVYNLTKENKLYTTELVGTAVLDRPTTSTFNDQEFKWYYGTTKTVFWKSKLDITKTGIKQSLTFADDSVLSIHNLMRIGNSIPDIATWWVAVYEGKIVSINHRESCWRSDDGIYENWVKSLVSKYSPVIE